MLELYHAGRTTCSRKARLCLAEKGLDYVSHYMNLGAFENHTPEYLKLNPNGVVPTLVHDGRAIIESTFINEYIDEVFPEPSLRPSDPGLRADMRVWGKLADEYGLSAVRVPTWTRTKKANIDALNEKGELDAVIARIPLQDHKDKYRLIAGEGFSDADFEEAYAKMDTLYAKTEAALANGPWLVGGQYTLADINMLPFITQFGAYRPELLDGKSHPRTKEWHTRCMARPAVIKTYPPSDEAPERPPQKQPAA
ncbi:MAG: glutathione S-transferase family protein [Rhodospirillaceae bacterium]|nr:glutathione S-transferase family protein [Rhodospirillaceae bacterium]